MKGNLTIGDVFAMLVSLVLPRRVKYYAMLDWFDWLDGMAAEELDVAITAPGYTVEYKKTVKE